MKRDGYGMDDIDLQMSDEDFQDVKTWLSNDS